MDTVMRALPRLSDPELVRTDALIAGEWRTASDLARFPVNNPVSGAVIAQVTRSTRIDTHIAIEAAASALKSGETRLHKTAHGFFRNGRGFGAEAGVVALANATESGLAANFFGRDIDRAWCIAEPLEYGMVGVNTGSISTEVAPFGGVKQSGIGQERSKYGIDEYVEKSSCASAWAPCIDFVAITTTRRKR